MSETYSPKTIGRPPRQENLATAITRGFQAASRQPAEQLRWLGAEPRGKAWRLPVLDDVFEIDLWASRVTVSAGRPVGPHWTILALHYLAIAGQPEQQPPTITFADLATARSYAGVYHARVNARLCATAGRDADRLTQAALALGGRVVVGDAGDAAFDFHIVPRVTVRLIWHAPDEEFPPSATLLLPPNIESWFCAEDTVVLSECLVARLGGKPY